MKAVFITGTDTGAGKTVVSGLLARFISEKGYSAVTQKWAQTGSKGSSSDIDVHLRLMNRKRRDVKELIPHMAPYTFKHASSPHLAAALESKNISAKKIKKSFGNLSKRFDFVIVEGAGGALVPLNRRMLMIDMAKRLRLPVIIVASNKLGAINHALLSIEAVEKRKMEVIGVLFNRRARGGDNAVLRDNPEIIKAFSGAKVLGELPYSKNTEYLYKKFIPAGKKILTRLLTPPGCK